MSIIDYVLSLLAPDVFGGVDDDDGGVDQRGPIVPITTATVHNDSVRDGASGPTKKIITARNEANELVYLEMPVVIKERASTTPSSCLGRRLHSFEIFV